MMMMDSSSSRAAYVARHEKFVSGHHGSDIWEVQLVCSVGPLALLLRNLAVPWLFPAKDFSTGSYVNQIFKLLLDYCISVVPILLGITVWSDRLLFLVSVLSASSILLLVFSLCEYAWLYRERTCWSAIGDYPVPQSFASNPLFVTYFRAHILISTILGILAVDFAWFPRRFAKAETFGYGLMDVGVGMFVIMNGLVVNTGQSCPPRRVLLKTLKSSLPLLALGVVRLLAVKLSGYHQHVTEYGVHWNFFFTLAVVKILGSLFSSFFVFRYAGAGLGLLFGLVYEYALQYSGLKGVVIFGSGPADRRDNLFDANREGIVSIFGYMALYFFGMQLGQFVKRPRRRLSEYGWLLIQLINLSFLTCILLLVCEVFLDLPSRRLVNLTYVCWMMLVTFTQLTLFAAVETIVLFGGAAGIPIFSADIQQPFRLFEPCLWKCINGNALGAFLLANVCTGLVNLNFGTLDADRVQCLVILFAYSFTVCAVFFLKYCWNWRRQRQRHQPRKDE